MSNLDPLDPELVKTTLSSPPFVLVEGAINIRCLPLKPNPALSGIWRSGELTRITAKGKEQLRALGVTKVIDFRSVREVARFHTPPPQIEGVEVINIPALAIERKEDLTDAYARFASLTVDGFIELYCEILDQGGSAFKAIFEHIRDRPREGLLFHCTAGKDRTGMAAMLILLLAGVDDETIAADYALTRIGIEPAREVILARFSSVPGFHENIEIFAHGFGSRHSTMIATLNMFRDKYGGTEVYLKDFCGLSEEDIATIKRNLIPDALAATQSYVDAVQS